MQYKAGSKTNSLHRENALNKFKHVGVTYLEDQGWGDFQVCPLIIMALTTRAFEQVLRSGLCEGYIKAEAHLKTLVELLKPWTPLISKVKLETWSHLFVAMDYQLTCIIMTYCDDGRIAENDLRKALGVFSDICNNYKIKWPSNSVFLSENIPETYVLNGMLVEILLGHPKHALQVLMPIDRPKKWRKPYLTYGLACSWLATFLDSDKNMALDRAEMEMNELCKIWWSSSARDIPELPFYEFVLLWIAKYTVTGNIPRLAFLLDDFRGFTLDPE